MHGTSFGKAKNDKPQLSHLCRSWKSLSNLLFKRPSGEHPRNGPQSMPKSFSKEPRNKKKQPRSRSQQVAGFVGIFSFGESDGMFDRQQNFKTKCRIIFAALHMHRTIGNDPQDTLALHSSRRTFLIKHPAGNPMFVAKQIIKSVKENRTQKPKQRHSNEGMERRENELRFGRLRVKPYTHKTDRDDSSFRGLLCVFSRSFAAWRDAIHIVWFSTIWSAKFRTICWHLRSKK